MTYRIDVPRKNEHKILIPAIFEACGNIESLSIVESGYLDASLKRIKELEAALTESNKHMYNYAGRTLQPHPLLVEKEG